MEEYKIRFLDMPHTVKGFTIKDDNEFYNIYINSHLCHEAQHKAIKHELAHIQRQDFESYESIKRIENL